MSDTRQATTAETVDENAAAARRDFFVRQVIRRVFWLSGPLRDGSVRLYSAPGAVGASDGAGHGLTDEQRQAVLEVLGMQE